MSAAAKVFRYEVRVDDQWHAHDLHGPVLHVAGRTIFTVEFWAMHQGDISRRREFRVFGTGQPVDAGAKYVGTVVHTDLVWHLFERAPLSGASKDGTDA